jgi:hypothetical protein
LIFFYLVIPIEVVYAKETLDAGDLGYGCCWRPGAEGS